MLGLFLLKSAAIYCCMLDVANRPTADLVSQQRIKYLFDLGSAGTVAVAQEMHRVFF